jgi:hypothetical protein
VLPPACWVGVAACVAAAMDVIMPAASKATMVLFFMFSSDVYG